MKKEIISSLMGAWAVFYLVSAKGFDVDGYAQCKAIRSLELSEINRNLQEQKSKGNTEPQMYKDFVIVSDDGRTYKEKLTCSFGLKGFRVVSHETGLNIPVHGLDIPVPKATPGS